MNIGYKYSNKGYLQLSVPMQTLGRYLDYKREPQVQYMYLDIYFGLKRELFVNLYNNFDTNVLIRTDSTSNRLDIEQWDVIKVNIGNTFFSYSIDENNIYCHGMSYEVESLKLSSISKSLLLIAAQPNNQYTQMNDSLSATTNIIQLCIEVMDATIGLSDESSMIDNINSLITNDKKYLGISNDRARTIEDISVYIAALLGI